jgi:hypothetical protein
MGDFMFNEIAIALPQTLMGVNVLAFLVLLNFALAFAYMNNRLQKDKNLPVFVNGYRNASVYIFTGVRFQEAS